MIDGAKALAAGVRSVFGDLALIQRCQIHKRRNVKEHLPANPMRDDVDARLRGAFADPDPDRRGSARRNASPPSSTRTHPDAAGQPARGPR